MSFKFSWSLFLIPLFFAYCKKPKQLSDLENLNVEIEYQTSPCFGKCPFFILTVYKGGIVRFEGKKFVRKFGTYVKKLKKRDYKKLKKAFIEANLWSLENSYSGNIPDIPKHRISFFHNGKQKTIIGDMTRPEIVLDLENKLEAIAQNEVNWTVLKVPNPELQDFYIKDELVIGLKRRTDIKEWIKKYPDWNMEVLSSISKPRNIWVIRFEKPDFNPAQVANWLSMDEEINVLEFNKKDSEVKE